MIRQLLTIAMLPLLLAGCDDRDSRAPANRPGFGANGRRELTGSTVDLGGEKGGRRYADFDAFRDRNGAGLAFAGYGCLSNCADVIGGYRQALRQKIRDARLCTGRTWGELEGCVAYTQGLPSELSNVPPLKDGSGPASPSDG